MPFDVLEHKSITVTLCAYEVVAILVPGHRVPTITELHRRHPSLGVALTVAMSIHFLQAKKGSDCDT